MATKGHINFRSDYKYQLVNNYEIYIGKEDPKIKIPIVPKSNILTHFIELDTDGNLLVKRDYAWDGPSGPVKDSNENMRASLIHDALYQLMRQGELSQKTHRKGADQLFKDICKEDGVSVYLASIYYKALRKFGKPAASPANKKVVTRCP